MCRAVAAYLQGLRAAWQRGFQPGHDCDSVLTRIEEEREVFEPQTSQPGHPPPRQVWGRWSPPAPPRRPAAATPNAHTAQVICAAP